MSHVLQGVPTSLGYAKCNVLKLRKVCERSELSLQKDPKKEGEICNANHVTWSKFPPFYWVTFKIFPLFIGSKFKSYLFLSGQSSKFTPFYWVKIQKLPLFIGSKFEFHPFLSGQYFVNVARFARKLFGSLESYI